MKQRPKGIPAMYVEGVDDVSAIAAILKRHRIDTREGQQNLWINPVGSLEELLQVIPDHIKNERESPCGFVLDIDIAVRQRWQAVRDKLSFHDDPSVKLIAPVPNQCPENGFIGQVEGYKYCFGVWLMPDCRTDGKKLEHLLTTLIPSGDPLWDHAKGSTAQAAELVDNMNRSNSGAPYSWERFGDVDTIKAEVRAWLAWQKEPGIAFGAAINSHILGHDSPEALAFLDWMKRLYNFSV